MKLQEIENLSHAELKERRDELVASASQQSSAELGHRYVQARTDAAHRDEKLAEQGKTIEALQAGAESFQEQLEVLQQRLASKDETIQNYARELEQARQAHSKEVAAIRDQLKQAESRIAELQSDLTAETARADRNKQIATKHHKAVVEAAGLLNSAMAEQAVENTDKG